jgi:hypothetical protein
MFSKREPIVLNSRWMQNHILDAMPNPLLQDPMSFKNFAGQHPGFALAAIEIFQTCIPSGRARVLARPFRWTG